MIQQFFKQFKKINTKDFFLVLFIFCLFSLFFLGGPTYYSKLSFYYVWNIGHIIFFFLSSYLIIKLLKDFGNTITLIITIVFTIGLGLSIELIQSKIDRSVDWLDMYRNLLGASLAIILFLPLVKSQFKAIRFLLLLLIIFLIVFDQIQLYKAIKSEIQAQINFPILAGFENANEIKQWSGQSLQQSLEYSFSGAYSMKVTLFPGNTYSGFTFKHFPGDWSGYNHLNINIYNPEKKTLKLTLKITDYQHDNGLQRYSNRFNRQIKLKHGWNQLKISLSDIIKSPGNRKMNISDISQIGFFTIKPDENKTIYIDNIRLF